MSITNPGNAEAEVYAKAYSSFASTLRTWLVAYGIGAPVLFASQNAFSEILKNKSAILPVIYAFLAGVSIQILAAFMYKASMWYIMVGAEEQSFKSSIRYRTSDWVSEQLWLEFLLDLGSIICFAWATTKILILFAAT